MTTPGEGPVCVESKIAVTDPATTTPVTAVQTHQCRYQGRGGGSGRGAKAAISLSSERSTWGGDGELRTSCQFPCRVEVSTLNKARRKISVSPRRPLRNNRRRVTSSFRPSSCKQVFSSWHFAFNDLASSATSFTVRLRRSVACARRRLVSSAMRRPFSPASILTADEGSTATSMGFATLLRPRPGANAKKKASDNSSRRCRAGCSMARRCYGFLSPRAILTRKSSPYGMLGLQI